MNEEMSPMALWVAEARGVEVRPSTIADIMGVQEEGRGTAQDTEHQLGEGRSGRGPNEKRDPRGVASYGLCSAPVCPRHDGT